MSSAILYLAIIAIWAGFLVPAWVRRPHAAPAASPGSSESSAGSHEDAGPGEDAAAGFAAGELDVEDVTETENDVAATPAADADAEVSRREPDYRAHEYSDHESTATPSTSTTARRLVTPTRHRVTPGTRTTCPPPTRTARLRVGSGMLSRRRAETRCCVPGAGC